MKGKYNNLFFVLVCSLFVVFGFFSYQFYVFYQLKVENDRLVFVKGDYKSLIDEIDNYKQLKNQYEIILSEGSNLSVSKEGLEKKIDELNDSISDLENKILNINKKIKNLS